LLNTPQQIHALSEAQVQKTILITGCSSGIGGALAREFRNRGHRVYATARHKAGLASLEAEGIRGLVLDVNDDGANNSAIETLTREAGHLDVLVNNAGFGQIGAVVDLTREDLRRQFETNVIAPVALISAAMPLLRAAVAENGSAVVANVGSIVEFLTTPFLGAYCASKVALHSLTDALRMELAPFGINVVAIQPGSVRSSFGQSAEIRLPESSMYKPLEALLRNSPPRVVRGGAHSIRLPLLTRLLPAAAFDSKLSKNFGLVALR
jgi:NAD(P)-dependent dehydrogenase (short-subunit alcohol dehydrogenase family)